MAASKHRYCTHSSSAGAHKCYLTYSNSEYCHTCTRLLGPGTAFIGTGDSTGSGDSILAVHGPCAVPIVWGCKSSALFDVEQCGVLLRHAPARFGYRINTEHCTAANIAPGLHPQHICASGTLFASATAGPLIIVALQLCLWYLETQHIHPQYPKTMSNCYNTKRSYGMSIGAAHHTGSRSRL